MRHIRAFLLRLGGLFHKERHDRDIADEIESNLQLHIEDNLRAGMSPEEARRDALLKFGGVESAKEAYRDRRGLPLLGALAQDIRYAFRQIGKYPMFVAIVVLNLGLGTGATTAIFSVVNAVLLRALPYRDPSRLVWVTQRYSLSFGPGFVLGPDYRAWRRERSSFEEIEAFYGGAPDTSLASKGAAIAVRETRVTSRFFSMLGINPILGRSFTDAEGAEGRNQVALLLDEVITAYTVMQRFRMVLLSFFALLAFVLAVLGIFGVMSFSVSQRTREMAVRVAIGAQRSSVIWLVVRQGMSVAAFGLAGGILGALGLTRFLSSFLYDVKPTDIITFLAAVLLLTGASFVACYLPARRASSVDPVKALRVE